jgi:hypothetical protein
VKTTRDMSDRHERRLAEVLEGRITRGSGSTFKDQGDGKQAYRSAEFVFCWDGKATRARSASVKLEDWEKITEQSHWARPLLPIRFYHDDRLTRFTDLVVLDLETFADLQSTANEIAALRERIVELEQGLPEFQCPACDAVTRARMADFDTNGQS